MYIRSERRERREPESHRPMGHWWDTQGKKSPHDATQPNKPALPKPLFFLLSRVASCCKLLIYKDC